MTRAAPKLVPACTAFAAIQVAFMWYARGDSQPILHPAVLFGPVAMWGVATITLALWWIKRTKQTKWTTPWGLACAALIFVGNAAAWLALAGGAQTLAGI